MHICGNDAHVLLICGFFVSLTKLNLAGYLGDAVVSDKGALKSPAATGGCTFKGWREANGSCLQLLWQQESPQVSIRHSLYLEAYYFRFEDSARSFLVRIC